MAVFSLITLVSVSCEERCNLPEGVDSGAIIQQINGDEVIVYPSSGSVFTNQLAGQFHEDGTSEYAESFTVSLDGGYTRIPVDYSQYIVIANPTHAVKCDATLDRNVTIDDAAQTVIYTVSVNECDKGCDELRQPENWVLIPRPTLGPSNYTYLYY